MGPEPAAGILFKAPSYRLASGTDRCLIWRFRRGNPHSGPIPPSDNRAASVFLSPAFGRHQGRSTGWRLMAHAASCLSGKFCHVYRFITVGFLVSGAVLPHQGRQGRWRCCLAMDAVMRDNGRIGASGKICCCLFYHRDGRLCCHAPAQRQRIHHRITIWVYSWSGCRLSTNMGVESGKPVCHCPAFR